MPCTNIIEKGRMPRGPITVLNDFRVWVSMLMILAKMFKIRQVLMKKGFSISNSFAFFRNKFDDSVSVARGSCNTLCR